MALQRGGWSHVLAFLTLFLSYTPLRPGAYHTGPASGTPQRSHTPLSSSSSEHDESSSSQLDESSESDGGAPQLWGQELRSFGLLDKEGAQVKAALKKRWTRPSASRSRFTGPRWRPSGTARWTSRRPRAAEGVARRVCRPLTSASAEAWAWATGAELLS